MQQNFNNDMTTNKEFINSNGDFNKLIKKDKLNFLGTKFLIV